MIKMIFSVLILAAACSFALAESSAPAKPRECPYAKAKKCGGLCPEKMKGVETVSLNTDKGVEITMTAKDKELAAKVQEMALVHYNSKETMEKTCPGRVPGAEIQTTNIENGVKVAITGKDADTIKKIQAASMKEHKPMARTGEQRKSSKKEVKQAAGFICPMGCAESEKPGKCPKCGMDMVTK